MYRMLFAQHAKQLKAPAKRSNIVVQHLLVQQYFMTCPQHFLLKECFAFYKTFRPNVESFSQLFNIVELTNVVQQC